MGKLRDQMIEDLQLRDHFEEDDVVERRSDSFNAASLEQRSQAAHLG